VEFTALLRSKRRVRQQQMTVILLLTAIVGLAIAGLLLAVGGFSGSDQNKPATAGAKKAHAGQSETESPEALESQGAESLDKRRKSSTVEPSKKRAATSGKSEKVGAKTPTPAIGRQSAAASSERAETGKPSGSKEAEPKKKPREPQPGTPEGDFGLPEVDKSIE
jgi:cytoskeletal protein RodZ